MPKSRKNPERRRRAEKRARYEARKRLKAGIALPSDVSLLSLPGLDLEAPFRGRPPQFPPLAEMVKANLRER